MSGIDDDKEQLDMQNKKVRTFGSVSLLASLNCPKIGWAAPEISIRTLNSAPVSSLTLHCLADIGVYSECIV
jgi:hypothetical protein